MSAIALSPQIQAWLFPLGWFLAAYSLGSIPEAWLLTRWITGRDLRRIGSGNVGVMNTALSVTRWAGMLVFLTEIAKGLLAVSIPRFFSASESILCLGVVGVVIGVRWPIWIGFKGGRGNTAGMTAFVMISLPAAILTLAFWILARLLLNSSFNATRLAILSLPLVLALVTRSWWFVFTGVALSLIYLSAQRPENDDHLFIKQHWASFWGFLTSPVRRR